MRRLRMAVAVVGILIVGTCTVSMWNSVRLAKSQSADNRACMAQVSDVSRALRAYARRHEGVFPASLDELVARGEIAAGALVCPKSHKPYVYVGGQVIDDDARITLLLFEQPGDHIGVGCHADGEVRYLKGDHQALAISFTRDKLAEQDERVGRACGIALTRDAALAWVVTDRNGMSSPPDAAQTECLQEGLRRLALEDTIERRCRAKWAEIVANGYGRFTTDGLRLFHLEVAQDGTFVRWRKARIDAPWGFSDDEHRVAVADFAASLPEAERERARQVIEEAAAQAGSAGISTNW